MRGEAFAFRGDGSRFPIEISSVIYRDADGQERSSMTMRDLSSQQAAHTALRSSQAYSAGLQTAIDAHAMLSITDIDGNITFANDLFCAVSGYTREELIGHAQWALLSDAQDAVKPDDMSTTVRSGQVWRGEIAHRAKNGERFWVEATVVPLFDGKGQLTQFVGVRTDISERKQAEARRQELEVQLRASQKLQAVGTLASGIAHDFNNIVAAILGFSKLIEEEVTLGKDGELYLQQIQLAGKRARDLVQRILTFSRPQPASLTQLALQDAVRETLSIVRPTLPAGVSLHSALPQDPISVLADSTQLQQVLLNLYTNAWHSLHGSTRLIETGVDRRHFSEHDRDRPPDLPPGEYAHLWVTDSGCGMDEALRTRIFEPFFTTKPIGQGTGLGLAAVHGIVSAHKGAIAVDSRPGDGSTFGIYLPLVQQAAEEDDIPDLPIISVSAAERNHVLLVDDEPPIARLLEAMMVRAGLQVTVFGDSVRALSALRANPKIYDLLLTDYNMPGLSGLELAQASQQLNAELPIIIISGYIDANLRQQAAKLGLKHLLNKERLIEDLMPAVQDQLRQVVPPNQVSRSS